MAPKNSIGSLSQMAKNIKGQKATAAKPSATFSSAGLKGKTLQDSDSSSDDSSSSSSGSDSDSDSEERLAALKQKLSSKKAPGATSDKPTANGSASRTKATPAASKSAEQASTSSSDSSDSSSGSDSNSDSEEAETAKPAQKKPTTPAVKQPETTTSSSGESDSGSDGESDSGSDGESDSEPEAGTKVKPAATPAAKPAAKHSTTPKAVQEPATSSRLQQDAASDSSDSEEDSEEDSEDDAMAVAKTNGTSQPVDVSRPEWLNKSDFMLRKAASDNPGKEVAEFLSKSNLEGKQVWYFTAPASLPISVIKDMEIDLARAQSGGAILNHAGDAYGLDLEPYVTSSQIQLLIPSQGGEKYNSVNRSIDSTVHLRRIAEFGGASNVSSTATDDYVRKPKPIKQQPKNLQARFTPIGVPTRKLAPVVPTQKGEPASGSDSDSDSDSTDVEMTNAPGLPKAPEGSTKRKQPADEDSDSDSSDSSDSDEEPAPPKPSSKSLKRTKTETAPPSSQASKVSKSTPVPPPSFTAKTAVVLDTPSKAPDSSKSKKGKTKKADEGAAKKVSQTPIPLPKLPGSGI